MSQYILVIDEGTTSTRAIAYDRKLNEAALAQRPIPLTYPKDGWVEQDGGKIWTETLAVCREVIESVGGVEAIAAIGITNQRETTLVWDKETGEPIETGEGRVFAGNEDRKSINNGLTKAPELGTYTTKLMFVTAGPWSIGVQFRRDSTKPLQNMQQWMQQVSPESSPTEDKSRP